MSSGWIRWAWLPLAALLTGGLSAQAPTPSGGLEINAFQRALPAPGDTVPATARLQYPQALAWDTQTREIHAKDGEQSVDFRFALTNVWTKAVTITGTKTSCGCTVARLPETPWVIQPGQGGEISGNMNLLGKAGTLVKTVTVSTDVGSILLNVKVHIAPADPSRTATEMWRGPPPTGRPSSAANAPPATWLPRWARRGPSSTQPPAGFATTLRTRPPWYPRFGS
jgi:hypothetical protein